MGLVVFAVMGIYLLISIGMVKGAIEYAREKGKSAARWGWVTGLVLYLIPFWDLIPTFIAYGYDCTYHAGFFVYKPIEQWKRQNPGVMETLSMAHLPEQFRIENDKSSSTDRRYLLPDGTLLTARIYGRNKLEYVEYKKTNGESGYQLNERFRYFHTSQGPGVLKLARNENVVIDTLTNEIVAKEINFRTATKGHIWSTLNGSGWKFWFQSYDSCQTINPKNFPNGGFSGFKDDLKTDCTPERKASAQNNELVVACREFLE